MVIPQKMIHKAFQLTVGIMLLLFYVSCKEEKLQTEADFIGKWKLTEISVDGVDKVLSVSEMDSTLYFKQIGILELNGYSKVLQRSGWNYQDGMLNIAIHLPASYYVQEITNTDLELKRLDFVNGNTISTTVTHFLRTE